MFTSRQITQLILLVNKAFTAQLKYSKSIQSRNNTPTLRSVTPRTPTPVPQDSPFKFWAESFAHVVEASDKMLNSLERATTPSEEDIDALRKKARELKEEYRQCFMSFSGDESPDQANELYQTAQKEANSVYQAAYKDPNRDAEEDAKAQFIASFTIALTMIVPLSRLRTTTASSIENNNTPDLEDSFNDDVHDISATFSTI